MYEDGGGAPANFDGVSPTGPSNTDYNDVFLVKYSPQSSILYTKTDVDCYGNSTGSIDITPDFGVPPYTYAWTGPNSFSSTQEDVSNLVGGMYYITVTDGGSMSVTDSILVVEPPQLVLTAGQPFDATACDVNDGKAHIIASGGTQVQGGSAYYYQWDDPNNQTSQLATQLYPGPYQVIVTDANGCMDSLTITVQPYVSDNDIITFTLPTQTGLANIDAVNHTVTIEVSQGTGPNQFIANNYSFELRDNCSEQWNRSGFQPRASTIHCYCYGWNTTNLERYSNRSYSKQYGII